MKNSIFSPLSRWGWLLLLVVAATAVALGIVVQTSRQQTLTIAEEQAQIDASLMRRWFDQERQLRTVQAAQLAAQLTPDADLASLLAAAGLDEQLSYAAWLDSDGSTRAAPQTEVVPEDVTALPIFRAISSLGAATEFFGGGSGVALLSMAAIDESRGGGVLILQFPLDEARLAAVAERPVLFLAYDTQQPLSSSSPELLTTPPQLEPVLLREVATSQQARSVIAPLGGSRAIVGLAALPDFANLGFSGYLALVEPAPAAMGLIPQWLYGTLIAASLLILLVGCLLVQRQLRGYLDDYPALSVAERRGNKLRMGGIFVLFLVPALCAGGYMLWRTGDATLHLNTRTARIANHAVTDVTERLGAQVAQFVENGSAARALQAAEGESLQERVSAYQQEIRFDFVVVAQDGEVVSSAITELSADELDALRALGAGGADPLVPGGGALLAAKQRIDEQTTVSAGYFLSGWLTPFTDGTSTEATLLHGGSIDFTTLNSVQRAALSERDQIMERAEERPGEPFRNTIGWNENTMIASAPALGGEDGPRILLSQENTAYANATTTYHAEGVAILVLLIVIAIVSLIVVFTQDQPLKLNRIVVGYLFLLPAIVWLIWWKLGPALFTIYLSLHKWSVLDPTRPFVGLHNYRLLFADERFWNAMINTVIYLIQIPIGMAISLALALVLNQKLRGIRILRTIYYIPAVTSLVVVALMWRWIYNKDFGILNYLLSFLNLGPYGWLQSVQLAMPSIMIMAIWLGLGARMLLFLAGLQSISDEYYDAASVDGATGWSRFRFITFPLLMPTTFFVLITSVIGSFQVFTPVYVLTGGGPAGSTDVAVHRIYFEAWQNLRFGYASAETVVLFVCLFALTILQFRYFGERVDYVR